MLALEHLGQNAWRFQADPSEDQQLDAFHDALALMDAGKLEAAKRGIRKVLRVCPEHIDAWHHLALLLEDQGDDLLSWACTREAVRLGLEALPKTFSWRRSRLEWGFLENRPFLRAYYTFGLRLLNRSQMQAAQEVFTRILSVNPNDNQGARYLLLDCLLATENWQEVLRIVHRDKHDISPDVSYTKVLALLALDEEDKAQTGLCDAVKKHPKVAQELLKSRHVRPKSRFPGTLTIGGDDEAFDYWERNKAYWAKGTRAYALLQQLQHMPKT